MNADESTTIVGMRVTVLAMAAIEAARIDVVPRPASRSRGAGSVLRAWPTPMAIAPTLTPGAEVISVQSYGAPTMTRSWHERRVITTTRPTPSATARWPVPDRRGPARSARTG
jgi:hypothetical protein